ncbi:FAR1-related sequence 5-like protein [Tanacetum coccineum]
METDLELKNINDNWLKEADMVVDDENNLVDTEIQEVDGLIVDIDEEENLVATTGESDAQMLINKMENRKKFVPNFTFQYKVENSELVAMFWADEVDKCNYKEFGDIISFDATFRTNKSFMTAHEKQPTMIVTDQDGAMKLAIEEVLTESKHRLFMWHIMQKNSSKGIICKEIYDETDFKERFNKIVWNMFMEPMEFEEKWSKLIEDFGLKNYKWMTKMFNLRRMWLPAYLIDSPLFGLMRTTSRSESENAFFKSFTNHGSTLVNFMMCFESTMEGQRLETKEQLLIEHLIQKRRRSGAAKGVCSRIQVTILAAASTTNQRPKRQIRIEPKRSEHIQDTLSLGGSPRNKVFFFDTGFLCRTEIDLAILCGLMSESRGDDELCIAIGRNSNIWRAPGDVERLVRMRPVNPPLLGGHRLRSGEDNMEHQIELMDNVPNTPHDSPLLRVNTPGSDKGSLELNKLIDLVTKLSHKVFDLEKVKTTQAKEIAGLKRRGRKHLKTQLQFREDAFDDIDDLVDEGIAFVQEKDTENQGKIGANDTEVVKGKIGADDIEVVKGSRDTEVLDTKKVVNTAGEGVSTASVPETVSTAAPRTPPTTTTVFDDEDVTIAMAQTLIKMKEEKAKEKGVVIKNVEDSSRPVRSITTLQPLPTIDPKDKGKGILQETKSVEKTKKKVQGDAQIERDAEVAVRLQAELDEELKVER